MIALIALWLATASPDVQAELDRLPGQRVLLAPDGKSYAIEDIAGEGAPRVGEIERRGSQLWLRQPDGAALRLIGPLAIPRIAGPGYKVWVIGEVETDTIRARRLGVLRGAGRRQGTSTSTTSVAPKPITSAPPGT